MSTSSKPIKSIVLAAGKGTRIQTDGYDLPKVMRLACDKPLLHYVLGEISFIPPEDTVIVVGYMKDFITESFPGYIHAEQIEQLGTGHAVKAAMPCIENLNCDLLVCYGDMPLIKQETYKALVDAHRNTGNACTLLSGTSDEPLAYGRILRDAEGNFQEVVEDRDCTPEQKEIKELNTGLYVFDAKELSAALNQLKCENSQGEYYLTDVPAIMLANGLSVGVCKLNLGKQIIGVNTIENLKTVEEELDRRV